MNKQVGQFQVEVTSPYPCWITIKTDRGEIRFSHRDLADLQHAAASAKLVVHERLGQQALHEVGPL